MAEQPREIWVCPACSEEVPDGTVFTLAQEGQEGSSFGVSSGLEVIWDDVRRVRFHPPHFRKMIGPRYYRTVDSG